MSHSNRSIVSPKYTPSWTVPEMVKWCWARDTGQPWLAIDHRYPQRDCTRAKHTIWSSGNRFCRMYNIDNNNINEFLN